MLPEGSVRAAHVWKRFRADRRRRKLRDQLPGFIERTRRRQRRGWRWALQDVGFEVRPGESIGLVGLNGSGKSTLLKILAQVMYPYAGSVVAGGRVGALIEVRSGIHPELTGRENIFFYGSMLGLRRRVVATRLDEIVAFAELEEAVDRQVKFYSTGMQMRLGFAVAAFLEPDVLLVDEVLAVGDATFQQKCLDRMREVLVAGTTLVYVSHDLPTVEATCPRSLWLDGGRLIRDGSTREVLSAYRQSVEGYAEVLQRPEGLVRLREVTVHGANGNGAATQEMLEVRLVFETSTARPGNLCIGVSEGTASPIFVLRRDAHLSAGETVLTCRIKHLPLAKGRYFVWGGLFDKRGSDLLGWHPMTRFDVAGPIVDQPPSGIVRLAPLHVEAEWEVSRL